MQILNIPRLLRTVHHRLGFFLEFSIYDHAVVVCLLHGEASSEDVVGERDVLVFFAVVPLGFAFFLVLDLLVENSFRLHGFRKEILLFLRASTLVV